MNSCARLSPCIENVQKTFVCSFFPVGLHFFSVRFRCTTDAASWSDPRESLWCREKRLKPGELRWNCNLCAFVDEGESNLSDAGLICVLVCACLFVCTVPFPLHHVWLGWLSQQVCACARACMCQFLLTCSCSLFCYVLHLFSPRCILSSFPPSLLQCLRS